MISEGDDKVKSLTERQPLCEDERGNGRMQEDKGGKKYKYQKCKTVTPSLIEKAWSKNSDSHLNYRVCHSSSIAERLLSITLPEI